MAQNTILTAATAAGTSTDITVAAGATVTLGIYTTDAGGLPGDSYLLVYQDTPGEDKFLFHVAPNEPSKVITGPGTFRCKKPASSVAYGAYTET
jgi:hypothetical protein